MATGFGVDIGMDVNNGNILIDRSHYFITSPG